MSVKLINCHLLVSISERQNVILLKLVFSIKHCCTNDIATIGTIVLAVILISGRSMHTFILFICLIQGWNSKKYHNKELSMLYCVSKSLVSINNIGIQVAIRHLSSDCLEYISSICSFSNVLNWPGIIFVSPANSKYIYYSAINHKNFHFSFIQFWREQKIILSLRNFFLYWEKFVSK
jgi:hypothetical protein